MLPRIAEEMQQWSAMLGTELATWPAVTTKPMFGMTAFYRGEQIFAVLPKTRAFETAKSVAFRLEKISDKVAQELKADARVNFNPIGSKWISFEVDDAKDLNAALEWMARAYEAARKTKSSTKSKVGRRKKTQ